MMESAEYDEMAGTSEHWSLFCQKLKEQTTSQQCFKGSLLLFASGPQSANIVLSMASQQGIESSTLMALVEVIEETCLPTLIKLYETFKQCSSSSASCELGNQNDAFVAALSNLQDVAVQNVAGGDCAEVSSITKADSGSKGVVSIGAGQSYLEEVNAVPDDMMIGVVKQEMDPDLSNHSDQEDIEGNTKDNETDNREFQKTLETDSGPKYHCQECYRPFHRLSTLEAHRQKKHQIKNDSLLQCKVCGHEFASTSGLTAHIRRKHPSKKKNLCQTCGLYFDSVAECQKHRKEYHAKKKRGEKQRGKSTKKNLTVQKKAQGRQHLSRGTRQRKETRSRRIKNPTIQVKKPVEYTCGKCKEMFVRRDAMLSHIIDQHPDDKDLLCGHCGQYFETLEACRDHVQSHFGDGRQSLEAQSCLETFKTKDETEELEEQYHDEPGESTKDPNVDIRCHLCGRRFYTLCSLQRHILRNHHDEKDRLCRYCGQFFRDAQECSSHVRVHIAENKKSREGFKEPTGLVNGKYSCQLCGRTFRLAATLRCHRLRAHPLEKDRLCPRCGKYFETEEACTKHRRLHVEKNWHGKNRARSITNLLQGPKVIKCHLCSATFYVRGGIGNHVQRKHPAERHRICRYCGRYFSTINECRTHVRLHVIERRQLRDSHQERLQSLSKHQASSVTQETEVKEMVPVSANGAGQETSEKVTKSVQCEACGKEYKLLSSFRRHISQYHSEIQDRLCHHCGTVLENAAACKEHLEKEHSQPQKAVSTDSLITFPDKFEHSDIKESVDARKPRLKSVNAKISLREKKSWKIVEEEADGTIPAGYMKCALCPSILGSRSSMRDHIKSIHSKCQDHMCACCGKYFDDPAECLEHQQTSSFRKLVSESEEENQTIPPGYIKCSLCTSVLGSRKSMRDHIRSLHFKEKEHMCTCCGKYFEKPSDRDEHQKPQVNLSCDFCPRVFKTQFARDSHMKRHVNQRDFQCDICGNCYFDKKGLNAHRERHEAQAKGMFQCPQCEKVLSSRKNLEIHMRIHNNERPYICEICGKGFTLVSTMKIHRNIHSGIKPYECEVCGKKARTKGDLGRHMSLHSDKKEFVCDICGKSYRFQTGLNQHRAVHTGLRPHVCKMCGCTYKTSNDLRKHMKTHKPGAKTKGTTVPRVPVPIVSNDNDTHLIYTNPSVAVPPPPPPQHHHTVTQQLPPPPPHPHPAHPPEISKPQSSHHPLGHNPESMPVLPSRLNNTYTSEEMAVVMALQVLDDMSSAVEPAAVYGAAPQAIRRYEPNVPNYPAPPGMRRYDGGVANYPGPSSFRRYDGTAPNYP